MATKAEQARLDEYNATLEAEVQRRLTRPNAQRFDIEIDKARVIFANGKRHLYKGAVVWQKRDGSKLASVKDDPAQSDFDHTWCCGQLYKLNSAKLRKHEATPRCKMNSSKTASSDFEQSMLAIPDDLAYLDLKPLPVPSSLPAEYRRAWC